MTAALQKAEGEVLIQFEPDVSNALPQFRQQGALDGKLFRIGGKNERKVPVHLMDGKKVHVCNAERELATRLAEHLFGSTLRVQGSGRWTRDTRGNWIMLEFNIVDFDVLSDLPLSQVVAKLHAVKGSHWPEIDDPAAELARIPGKSI